MTLDAAIALTRFGLGARPGDMERIARAPKDWLRRQTNRRYRDGFERWTFPSTGDLARGATIEERAFQREIYAQEVAGRFEHQVTGESGFRERLVMFWSNHFAISIDAKNVLTAFAGAFEREAIRPRIFGDFEDLLLSATRHPAMLVYLDNRLSVGPNSRVGLRTGRGLNENHAREILELHTLGVNGGYTQQDVTNFAKVLTGWTTERRTAEYEFDGRLHEPGPQKILGRTYRQPGEAQGRAVLKNLARHPATARHIAVKLARHFHSDTPPEALVARLEGAFNKTRGHLGAVSRTLIEAPEMWHPAQQKIKTPTELVVSAFRAILPNTVRGEDLYQSAAMLAQRPFAPPSPEGWPDTAADWAGANAIMQRLEWAGRAAREISPVIVPEALANSVLGPMLTETSRAQIRGADSQHQAITLLLMAPEFQRR